MGNGLGRDQESVGLVVWTVAFAPGDIRIGGLTERSGTVADTGVCAARDGRAKRSIQGIRNTATIMTLITAFT